MGVDIIDFYDRKLDLTMGYLEDLVASISAHDLDSKLKFPIVRLGFELPDEQIFEAFYVDPDRPEVELVCDELETGSIEYKKLINLVTLDLLVPPLLALGLSDSAFYGFVASEIAAFYLTEGLHKDTNQTFLQTPEFRAKVDSFVVGKLDVDITDFRIDWYFLQNGTGPSPIEHMRYLRALEKTNPTTAATIKAGTINGTPRKNGFVVCVNE
ncbi:hypothetical protein HN587_07355 [Candidatus Woesearchaeota archaeon]|nr:hypothetical protein [Candidatus Woesearchaeota archaeon]